MPRGWCCAAARLHSSTRPVALLGHGRNLDPEIPVPDEGIDAPHLGDGTAGPAPLMVHRPVAKACEPRIPVGVKDVDLMTVDVVGHARVPVDAVVIVHQVDGVV